MDRLLFINGCVRGEESRTLGLARTFLKETGAEYRERNLCNMDLKPLVGEFFESRQKLLEGGNRKHPRFDYAWEFAEAENIAVAAPFWDLSVPAIVKIYIENISVDGITFGCNEQGMYGLCKAKNLYFFSTRGDFCTPDMEHGASYWKALCNMFGIERFHEVSAQGIDARPDMAEALLEKAREEAILLGRTYRELPGN